MAYYNWYHIKIIRNYSKLKSLILKKNKRVAKNAAKEMQKAKNYEENYIFLFKNVKEFKDRDRYTI